MSVEVIRSDAERLRFTASRVAHWDRAAADADRLKWNRAYHRRLTEIFRALVPTGERVLELGCGQGDLLSSLKASDAVGVDFSQAMVERGRRRYPALQFVLGDVHETQVAAQFDYVVMSDLLTDVWDVQQVLTIAREATSPSGRVIFNFYSHLWATPLAIVRRLGLSPPRMEQSWLTLPDVRNLLRLAGLELIQHRVEVLWPLGTPVVESLLNRVLVKLWPFSMAALTHIIVARPSRRPRLKDPSVSIVVPARNEAGNVEKIIERIPRMGASTEVIFVEGHSRDGTYEAIERAIAARPESAYRLFRQAGKGKGDAVRHGFEHAQGDVLMILDADLTVAPEELPKFLDILVSGTGEFVNGVRLVYPMGGQAMRFANLVANKLFGWLFTWLLGQPIRDTLCGTKVLWRQDYQRIARDRAYFGDFDPFGDFDLLFGAARFSRHIVEMPIRYRDRSYGSPNIRRWRDGLLLLRMSLVAARKLKCI